MSSPQILDRKLPPKRWRRFLRHYAPPGCALLVLLVCIRVLTAHNGGTSESGTPFDLTRAWNVDPLLLAGLEGSAALYGWGVYRLWQRAGVGHGIRRWQVAAFAIGLCAVFVALVSPLDALSHRLFSLHMLQHMILILVAAPLFAVSAAPVALLWAFSGSLRRKLGQWWNRAKQVRMVWHWLTRPLVAWTLSAVALWLWHVPGLYQAALQSDFLHGLEHLSFLFTSALFWWMVIGPPRQQGQRRQHNHDHSHSHYGVSVLALFTTVLQGGALGALLVFSSRLWYPVYAQQPLLWALTPLEDQQLAGLIMWVPSGVFYMVAAAYFFSVWLTATERDPKHRAKLMARTGQQ